MVSASLTASLTRVRSRSAARNAFIPLVLIMAFVGAVSFFFLQGQSLRLDESQSLWESGRSGFGILRLVAQDVHVPLYHELLHYWRLTIGNTVASARMLSLLFFLLAIPALYQVGKLAYNRTIGLFAALLLGLSPFMNWYGDEIRMYTLFALLTILNQYFFVRILQIVKSNAPNTHPRTVWIGYFLTALLGIYSHYFFFVNLLAQAVFYFMRRSAFPAKTLPRFLTTAVILVVAFAPWLWWVWVQGQIGFQQPLLIRPTTVDLFNVFSQFLFGFQTDALNTVLLSLWPISLLFAFFTLRKGSDLAIETQYFLTTFLFSVGAMFAVSLLVTPIFLSRYLIFVVPSLYLLLAVLFEHYPPRIRLFARSGLVLLMALTLTIEVASAATPVKEDYRGATDYLNAHATPQDVVIVSAPFTLYPVEYYYHSGAPLSSLPIWNQYAYGPIPPFVPDQLPAQVDQLTKNHQNVWLLLSYDQGYEKNIKSYFENHYQLLQSKTFSKDLTLYEFKVRYDTPLSHTSSGSTVTTPSGKPPSSGSTSSASATTTTTSPISTPTTTPTSSTSKSSATATPRSNTASVENSTSKKSANTTTTKSARSTKHPRAWLPDIHALTETLLQGE